MRRVKHILTYVLVLSMCFTLFFMPESIVHADSGTYTPYEARTCQLFFGERYFNSSVSGRLVTFRYNNNSTFYTYFVADPSVQSTFTFSQLNNSACSLTMNSYSSSYNYSGQYYMYAQMGPYAWSSTVDNMPIVIINLNTAPTVKDAVDYTYGSKSVDPSVTPTYGRVADVEYATRIAGSGLASADNIDRIVWNQSIDTNGNDLPTGARVQIRAVPGKYVGNTANDVLNKTYTDFVLDHSKQLIIVDIIASRGVYETKWSEVVDHFGFFPYSWVPNIQYLDNEYFKMGWIYQIRLQVDDYYSDWQNIYTATGSGASESQTITDSDELTQQLVQDINIVNQLNNTTTTNWYINEITINNSEYTENTDGKPWWAYLLEAILSLFQIGDGEQQTINNTNNLNIDLNDKLNEYNEIEDQQLNNLDTNLDAIEVESDMLENNKFVGSANWVAQQYTRMTNGTVIGSLIGFSLLFGLALIFIGKIR